MRPFHSSAFVEGGDDRRVCELLDEARKKIYQMLAEE